MRKLNVTDLHRLSVDEYKASDKTPLVVVLDNVRSLHNVGSVFRTCDAFRVGGVVLCGITAVPPQPEIHKTALGAENSVDWTYHSTAAEAVRSLHDAGYVVASVEQAEGSAMLDRLTLDPSRRYSVVLGNEVKGVAQAFRIDVPGLDKPLIGEFDLIVQDGRDVCIVDWKTSASRWPAGKADRDLQATVFSYAYEKLNGTTPLFRFDVITKTKNPGCESHYTSRGFHDFRRFEALANRAQYAINKGVFLPNETSYACGECPYRDRCRQWHLKKWR